MFNPTLSLAAASGIMEAFLESNAQGIVDTGAESPMRGSAPSQTIADYTAAAGNVAAAIASELDTILGQGFDVLLASNANPGVSVALTGAAGAAGAATCGSLTKPGAMHSAARGMLRGKRPQSVVATDYANIAKAIMASYQAWLAIFTANAS